MRNMWVDFRSNRASRRDFEMCVLPDLHARLVANAAAAVSDFDVVTINVPWLAEFAARGALHPIARFARPDDIQCEDFHPVVWSTGMWQQCQYGVPIYVTIEVLAARRDLFDEAGLAPPRTFDEVIAAGRALHAPARERVGIVWNAARGMPLAHSFMFFLGCCGSGVFEHARAGPPDAAHLGRVQIDSHAGRRGAGLHAPAHRDLAARYPRHGVEARPRPVPARPQRACPTCGRCGRRGSNTTSIPR